MAADPKSFRVLLAGPGGIGAVFVRLAAQAGDRLAGVVASTLQSGKRHAGAIAATYGPDAIAAFETLEAALAGTKPDGIVIAAPDQAHAALLRTALPTGLPILCEKPLVWNDDPGALQAELTWLEQYRDAPFVFNASNYTLLEGLTGKLAGQQSGAAFLFSFQTNGRHRGRDILKDLLPHCMSVLQKVFGTADLQSGHMTIEPHRCTGTFCYGSQKVVVDFLQGPDVAKKLCFGFEGHLYSRVQEGQGASYRVFLHGPHAHDGTERQGETRKLECSDPFAVSYGSFRHLMAGGQEGRAPQRPEAAGHDLGWAIENCRLCDQLIRAGQQEE